MACVKYSPVYHKGIKTTLHRSHQRGRSNIQLPDSKVHVANMGPTWAPPAPGGPHGGPINFAIRESYPVSVAAECTVLSRRKQLDP